MKDRSAARRAYPKDVSDEEWAFVALYLCLLPEGCGQRVHPLREVFNALRYAVWAGLALHVTPANEHERAQAGVLAAAVQKATGQSVQLAWVDQGYCGV